MNLYQESTRFSGWAARVIATFIRAKPAPTITVILSAGFARIAALLAFFLPLKIIILAGSDGVPRYFRGFIDPDMKLDWIIGLSAVAVALYVLNLVLDGLSQRLAAAASQEVTRNANKIRFLEDEEAAATTYYARFCGLAADTLFVGTGLGLGLWLVNTSVFALIIAQLIAAALFTAAVMASSDDVTPGRIKRFVQDKLGRYLRVISAIIFLSSFVFILYPFLQGQEPNLILSILSLLIIRQILGPATQSVREAVRLFRARPKIDALVFRQARYTKDRSAREKPVQQLFSPAARHALGRRCLRDQGFEPDDVQVHWEDSPVQGMRTLLLRPSPASDGHEQAYQLQAYPRQQLHRLENEDFLISKMGAHCLKAATTLSRFPLGPFQCRLVDYGTGHLVPSHAWPGQASNLVQHLWSCQPPQSVVNAYAGSHPLLHQQFDAANADRLDIAVDTDQEHDDLAWFRNHLPTIREHLGAVPLYVHNPDLNRQVVALTSDDDVRILTWGRWMLLPVGAVQPRPLRRDMIAGAISRLREQRQDIPTAFGEADMTLAAKCYDFQKTLQRGQLKAALGAIAGIRACLETNAVQEPVAAR